MTCRSLLPTRKPSVLTRDNRYRLGDYSGERGGLLADLLAPPGEGVTPSREAGIQPSRGVGVNGRTVSPDSRRSNAHICRIQRARLSTTWPSTAERYTRQDRPLVTDGGLRQAGRAGPAPEMDPSYLSSARRCVTLEVGEE